MSLDLTFVTPELAIGARFDHDRTEELARAHRIRRVVDLRVEEHDDEALLRSHGILLLHLPTDDTMAASQQALTDGVAFALEGLSCGEKILVHCQYGIGRSTLLALCILVELGFSPLDAMELCKTLRPVVSPSPQQILAFVTWCRDHRAGRTWDVPTVQAIGAIAWRHLRFFEDAEAASTRRG